MTFSIGIFDLFTYLAPGALYLTLAGYVSARLDWVPIERVQQQPTLLLLGAAVLLSYVLGGATYGLGRLVDQALPFWRWARFDARAVFAARVPAAAGARMLDVPGGVLLAAAELHNREVAAEATRMRAIGLMLRNATVPLLTGAVLAGIAATTPAGGTGTAWAASALLATAGGTAWRSVVLRHWADMKTLEICFLIPGLEERLRGPSPDGHPAPAPAGPAAGNERT